jgi:hypothetical protein
MVLLVPVAVAAVVRAHRREGVPARAWLGALVASLAGLAFYTYPAVAARGDPSRWVWGSPRDLRSIAALLLRADYWQHAIAPRYSQEYLAAAVHGLVESCLGIGLVPAAVGGVALLVARRARGGSTRWEGAALMMAAVLSGALVAGFPAYPVGARLAIAERFLLLPALVVMVPLSRGLDWMMRPRGVSRRGPWALVAAIAVIHVGWVRPRVREEQRFTGARFVRNVLGALPPHAVVLGQGDLYCFGFLYAQRALHLRPDVVYVEAGLLDLAWYRDRASRALGESMAPGTGAADLGAFAERLLDEGRPVFLTVPAVDLPAAPRRTGYAGLLRVMPRDEVTPPAEVLEAQNLAAMRPFEWDATPVREPWSWADFAQGGYRATWQSVAAAYASEGRSADAARNRARAARGALGP